MAIFSITATALLLPLNKSWKSPGYRGVHEFHYERLNFASLKAFSALNQHLNKNCVKNASSLR